MKEKTIIRRAIKVLERLNWITGSWFLKGPKSVSYQNCLEADSCCLDGALLIAKRGGHYALSDLNAARELIKTKASEKYNRSFQTIWQINDQAVHTKQDVINVLKESLN